MKTGKYFSIFHAAILCLLCGCARYPAYEITNPPFVNRTSLNMYIGDTVQLTASPLGESFVWSSENAEVASVSLTGMVKALGEGLSSITVKSSGGEANVDVRVRTFVPLTDIRLSTDSVKLYVGDRMQIWAYPVPDDASDVVLSWRSDNLNIATVDGNGTVTAVAKGVCAVTVGFDSIERIVVVSVPELYKCDKTEWSIEVSDQRADDGGGKDKVIDGDYGNGGFWHSQWGPNVACPHWAVIDMKKPVEIGRIVCQRRNNGDTKTLQYFVGDSPDANAGNWIKLVEGAYASNKADHTLTLDAPTPLSGRYLKLVLPDSFRDPYTAICEIDVYGFIY
ncbi:MAG: Ig-like domain-containing protein [Prevotellaceae bacterium]|jgi:hypothetical protein|nr:Ig-like domain-containing protein [Prevotellaceae bacterium]